MAIDDVFMDAFLPAKIIAGVRIYNILFIMYEMVSSEFSVDIILKHVLPATGQLQIYNSFKLDYVVANGAIYFNDEQMAHRQPQRFLDFFLIRSRGKHCTIW